VWNSRVKGGVLESFSWGVDGLWKDLRVGILKKKEETAAKIMQSAEISSKGTILLTGGSTYKKQTG